MQEETTIRELVSVIASATIAVAGGWLLGMIVGSVALLAAILVAVVYTPLRYRRLRGA